MLLHNDADGNGIRWLMSPALQNAGFTIMDAGPDQNGAPDFSAQIAKRKHAGVEIFDTFPFPPDPPVFRRQAAQKGSASQIKIVQIAKAGLFEQEMEVPGTLGQGMASGACWRRAFPFVSPVAGVSCTALADGFEKASSKPWSQQG